MLGKEFGERAEVGDDGSTPHPRLGAATRSGRGLLGALMVLPFLASGSLGQESGHYKTEVGIAPLSGRASSQSFTTSVAGAFITGSAGRCPAGFATRVGAWSSLRNRAVPVDLMLSKLSAAVDVPLLSWTGQAERFSVYASESPIGVVSPANLFLTTRDCGARANGLPKHSPLVFFQVVPSDGHP